MTRETKIGLLVGLAFIIVVGILLSQHATDAPAQLSDVGSNVRQGVASPAAAAPADAPQAKVPTRGDLAPKPTAGPAVGRVEVGPGAAAGGDVPPITIAGSGGGDFPRATDPALPPVEPTPGSAKPARTGGVADLLAQHPNDLARAGDATKATDPARPGTSRTGTNGRPATLPVTAPKTYVAEAGDSVSRIAARAMGGNTKANREALVKANPNLQGEGNLVLIGRTYVIPSPGATAQAVAGGTVKQAAPASPGFPAPPAAAPNTAWYTVRENDNLWRIAARELGDGNLWTQVRDLNRDVLNGGETVRANMRIRLPKGTATASAN